MLAIESNDDVRVQILAEELEGYLDPDNLGSGVHLTGGGSLLPGITEMASSVLGFPAKQAELPNGIVEELRNPEFSTVLGLLHFGLTGQSQVHAVPSKGIGRALAKFFGR